MAIHRCATPKIVGSNPAPTSKDITMDFGLAIFLAVAICIFALLFASADISTWGEVTPLPVFLGVVSAILFGWAATGYNTPAEREAKEFTVSTVNNVDIIVDGSKVINLNEKFDRDFKEGDIVYEKQGVWAANLWFDPYYSVER
jgi:hypothetical protein